LSIVDDFGFDFDFISGRMGMQCAESDWAGLDWIVESRTNLVETNVGGLLTEALTADVHLCSVLANLFQFMCIAPGNCFGIGVALRRTCG
jgi:hypothetical protein